MLILGPSTVRAVIFDLDGVVRQWDPAIMEDAERAASLPAGSLAYAVLGDQVLLRSAVTGIVTDEEWRTEIASRLQAQYGASAVTAVDAWSCSSGVVVSQVLEVVRWTRERTRVALLSNATTRLATDLRRLGIFDEFDDVFNTAELGVAKPDPAVFHRVCTDLGVPAGQSVFVDDSPLHVTAAREVGLNAHHFTNAKGLWRFLTDLPFG